MQWEEDDSETISISYLFNIFPTQTDTSLYNKWVAFKNLSTALRRWVKQEGNWSIAWYTMLFLLSDMEANLTAQHPLFTRIPEGKKLGKILHQPAWISCNQVWM